MTKRRGETYFPVECGVCKRVFDFGDYLTPEDENKHIAELVLEKCGGDILVCDKCKRGKRIVDSGKFQWVFRGEGAMIPELELVSENGKKRVLSVKNFDEEHLALVVKRKEFGKNFF